MNKKRELMMAASSLVSVNTLNALTHNVISYRFNNDTYKGITIDDITYNLKTQFANIAGFRSDKKIDYYKLTSFISMTKFISCKYANPDYKKPENIIQAISVFTQYCNEFVKAEKIVLTEDKFFSEEETNVNIYIYQCTKYTLALIKKIQKLEKNGMDSEIGSIAEDIISRMILLIIDIFSCIE